MMEWREVSGFPNYLVNEEGIVYSKERWVRRGNGAREQLPGRVVKGSLYRRDGRRMVKLCADNGQQLTIFVGAVVLRGFIGAPEPGQECRHLDGDCTNDRLSNLAWGTRAENQQDAVAHGTHPMLGGGEEHPTAKLTDAEVAMIKKALRDGLLKQNVIAKIFEVSQSTISDIKYGRSRT